MLRNLWWLCGRVLAAACVLSGLAPAMAAAVEKPNVVLILLDNVG